MSDTKMLQAILDGQSAIKEELKSDIKRLEEKVDKNTEAIERNGERIDKLGIQLSELADDAPTVDEFEKLEKKGEVVSVGTPSIDWLGVPLKMQDKTIGVLVVQSYTEGIRYSEEDKNILVFISNQIAMVIDRMRAEEEIDRSQEELQRLTDHIQNAREKERALVASELHDEVGQALTSLKMDIFFLGWW